MASPLVDAGLLPLGDVPYPEQLRLRHARVVQALGRAGLDTPVAPPVPSPRVTGYRARVGLRADGRGRLGFHRPGSHEPVFVPLDALAREEVVAAARTVEAAGTARGAVEIRSDGERVVVVLERPAELPGTLVVGTRRVRGDPNLRIEGLRVGPRSFYQVNLEVNRALRLAVAERVAAFAPARLLDLYAGVGNLSALPVGAGTPVTLIESDPDAVADARHNLPAATVVKADAGRFRAGDHFFDVAVLDPPRAGAPGVLAQLAVTRPRAVIYVSCEPTTLARDLATVAGRGYRLTEVLPFDIFPGTEHVETLAVLERA